MNLFSGDLSSITIADIENFLALASPVEQRPTEGLRIEYKIKETPDFSETVAAFANGYGGLLFIGVETDKAKRNLPISLVGELFTGGDIKARIAAKIASQVTPRPEFTVGIAAVVPVSDRYVAVIRVSPGSWPPYQFSSGDKVRIPVRIQDTNKQATLRDIEALFQKRGWLSKQRDERSSSIEDTRPLIPFYWVDEDSGLSAGAYQTWTVRPQLPLRLRLDRSFDATLRSAITSSFKDSSYGNFYPPKISNTELARYRMGSQFAFRLPLSIISPLGIRPSRVGATTALIIYVPLTTFFRRSQERSSRQCAKITSGDFFATCVTAPSNSATSQQREPPMGRR